MFISRVLHPFLNSCCPRNVVRLSSQTVSIPDPKNLPGAKAPYEASIPVGSPSKYVLKNYIYRLYEKKMY